MAARARSVSVIRTARLLISGPPPGVTIAVPHRGPRHHQSDFGRGRGPECGVAAGGDDPKRRRRGAAPTVSIRIHRTTGPRPRARRGGGRRQRHQRHRLGRRRDVQRDGRRAARHRRSRSASCPPARATDSPPRSAYRVIRDGASTSRLTASPRAIDAGRMAGRYFFNIAGVGFDARVAALFNARGAGARGAWPYLMIGVREGCTYCALDYDVRLDDDGRQVQGAADRVCQRTRVRPRRPHRSGCESRRRVARRDHRGGAGLIARFWHARHLALGRRAGAAGDDQADHPRGDRGRRRDGVPRGRRAGHRPRSGLRWRSCRARC